MTQKRRVKPWEPPPLNPRDFADPYRQRRQTRSSRHTVTTALKTLLKHNLKPDGP
jgi:hypothetical protein